MKVYGLNIRDTNGLTNVELTVYAKKLRINNFRGVYMRDTIPHTPHQRECGIVNLNTTHESGSHWVCYFKNYKKVRIYFDSFGQVTPIETQKYLKTKEEYEMKKPVIQRNTDIVQHVNTHVCGHLCLFVLRSLTREHRSFQDVLNELNDGYTQSDRKITTT